MESCAAKSTSLKPDYEDVSNKANWLIIHIARIGDLIQTSSVIEGLHQKYNNEIEIDLLVSESFRPAAELIPRIHRIHSISIAEIARPLFSQDKSFLISYMKLNGILQKLESRNYDHVLNLTHTDYSTYLTTTIRAKNASGIMVDPMGVKFIAGNWGRYYFNSFINRKYNSFNIVDIYCRMAGIDHPGKSRINIAENQIEEVEKFLCKKELLRKPLIGIVPGASSAEKRWHPEKFAETLKYLSRDCDVNVLIFGTQTEQSTGSAIARLIPGAINLCGKTNIPLLTAFLRKCDLVLTNDTGPMHIASAAGTRVVDISLGSACAFETAPFGTGHYIFTPDMDCYPCKPNFCCDHMRCHDYIDPAEVARLMDSILSGKDIETEVEKFQSELHIIYITDFDENSFLELKPLKKRALTARSIFKFSLKQMWIECLQHEFNISLPRTLLTEIRKFADFKSTGNFTFSEINTSGVDNLQKMAESAIDHTQNLISAAEKSHLNEIVEISAKLKEIDLKFLQIGNSIPELAPIIGQFVFEKEAIEDGSLKTLALQTKDLYQKIKFRCDVLQAIIFKTLKQLSLTSLSEDAA